MRTHDERIASNVGLQVMACDEGQCGMQVIYLRARHWVYHISATKRLVSVCESRELEKRTRKGG